MSFTIFSFVKSFFFQLAHALHVFNLNARGPAVQRFAKQLKWDCERLWKSGHQMCEVLSLTGNHCMNPVSISLCITNNKYTCIFKQIIFPSTICSFLYFVL